MYIISLPSSKSYLQRYYIATFISKNMHRIHGVSVCDDVAATKNTLQQLGVAIEQVSYDTQVCDARTIPFWNKEEIFIDSRPPTPKKYVLDVANSGTLLRMLSVVSSVLGGEISFCGGEQLSSRWMGDLEIYINALGGKVFYAEQEGYLPYRIEGLGEKFDVLDITIPTVGISSQYMSGILFVLGRSRVGSSVTFETEGMGSLPYVLMTLKVLEEFGVQFLYDEYLDGNIQRSTVLEETYLYKHCYTQDTLQNSITEDGRHTFEGGITSNALQNTLQDIPLALAEEQEISTVSASVQPHSSSVTVQTNLFSNALEEMVQGNSLNPFVEREKLREYNNFSATLILHGTKAVSNVLSESVLNAEDEKREKTQEKDESYLEEIPTKQFFHLLFLMEEYRANALQESSKHFESIRIDGVLRTDTQCTPGMMENSSNGSNKTIYTQDAIQMMHATIQHGCDTQKTPLPNKIRIQTREIAFHLGEHDVPSDWSSAGYCIGMGVLGKVPVKFRFNSPYAIQGDAFIVDCVRAMGGKIVLENDIFSCYPSTLHAIKVDLNMCPDCIPTLAVLAAFAHGVSLLQGIERLKYKESNRIVSILKGLQLLGITSSLQGNTLHIVGNPHPKPPQSTLVLDCYNDHRIAMAFSLALLKKYPIVFTENTCVEKSWPHFWDVMEKILALQ